MQPYSTEQFQDAQSFTVPAPLQVVGADGPDQGPEVWAVALPMPGHGAMSFVYSTILISADGVTVVDPGWPDREDIEASTFTPLADFLATRHRSIEDINAVIGTHGHPDHMGAVEPLARRAGARIAVGAKEMEVIGKAQQGVPATHWVVDPESSGAPAEVLEPLLEQQAAVRDRWYLPTRQPDILLQDGDDLADHGLATSFHFRAVETPGHTPGHLSFADHEHKILIAADMILPMIFPGIGLGVAELGGNPIEEYLESLQILKSFDDYLIIPGHGYCFRGVAERRRETTEHILVRAREVQAVLEETPGATAWQIASQLSWSMGWEGMQESRMLVSALRQTMMYRDVVGRRGLGEWLEG